MSEANLAKYAVVYRDDGPKGACGQSMSVTRKWTYVFLFNTEDEALRWMSQNPIDKNSRKNPHYAVCGNGYYDSISRPQSSKEEDKGR